MGALTGLARVFDAVNAPLLALGRWLGTLCMAIMLVVILVQVWCRYVLGSALAWPDETSRFLMLWMTGLMAPSAYRRGGFVGIDMLMTALPRLLSGIVALLMLCLSAVVLWIGANIGWAEATGFSGGFDTVSMNIPASFDFSEWRKVPRGWMTASLAVGCSLLLLVNVELILRSLIALLGGADRLPVIPETAVLGAE